MRLLNKKFARKTAAAALVLATAATLATGAFAAEDDGVVAGYMPPQEVMVQDDVALHSADVAVGEVDPNYGGYAAPEGNPIQGNIMLISAGDLDTPLPSDTQVEKAQAHYTVKGLLGKQVLYTARQEGSVLTLDFPENVATFRATILDLQTLMNDGVSTVVLQTNKTSTTLNLSLLCDDALPVGKMEEAIEQAAGKLLEEVTLFDVYKGDQIAAGKKSVSFSLRLRSHEGTLTDEQADAAMKRVLKALAAMDAVLREA